MRKHPTLLFAAGTNPKRSVVSDVVFEQAAASSMFYSCVDGEVAQIKRCIIHPQPVLVFSVFVFGKWKSRQTALIVNEGQKGNLSEDIFETSSSPLKV